MSKKFGVKVNRSLWCVMLPLLLFAFSGSCGNGADDGKCPDTSFSKSNLDTLVAKNPKFIWRICNANEEYAMENMKVNGDSIVELSTLPICNCSQYFSSIHNPINQVSFRQSKIDYSITYLDVFAATKGLTSKTSPIFEVPGRYSYHILRDTSEHISKWVEIEREAYY